MIKTKVSMIYLYFKFNVKYINGFKVISIKILCENL